MKRFDQLSAAGKAIVIPLYARARGYQATFPNISDPTHPTINPETAQQFVIRVLNEDVVRIALDQRAFEQGQLAANAARNDSDIN